MLVELALLTAQLAAQHDPAKLLADESLLKAPKSLAVVPSKTSVVYRAEAGAWQFNLHSYIAHYDGKFWALWSSGQVDEDSSSQLIRYSTSADGHTWSTPRPVADDPDGPQGPKRWIARGIYVSNGKLQALLAGLEGPRDTPEGRESWHALQLHRFEWNGTAWVDQGVLIENCMNNYPPRSYGGPLVMTCRDSYARMFTAREEGGRWVVTRLPGEPPGDRMSEPSEYMDADGVVHMIFRDANRSKFLYHSISRDAGRSWTAPVRTNFPDATSKNIGGKLSTGWYYLINNPSQTGRDPLGIAFSRDGWSFERPAALRMNAPKQRHPGRAKGPNSFQYPHAIEQGGSLWVIYSTNKEDIEISEYKLDDFQLPAVHTAAHLLARDGLLGDLGKIPDAPAKHSTVFRGVEKVSGFNLHSYIAHHDGRFWAMWSSSGVGEEDPDQKVLYSTSRDGHRWSKPEILAADPDGPNGPARWIARGIYVDGGKLTALAAYIESADYGKRGKEEVWKKLSLRRFEWSGGKWEARGVYAENCMNNFPPERLNGLLSLVCRDSNMQVSMALADAPGQWKHTAIASEPPYDKMDEPTYYATQNGEVHMIVRDNTRSRVLLRTISTDYGRTWSKPVRTNYPDATSKNFPGRLSKGGYFLINNPNPGGRDPLAVSFSRDGWSFDRPLVIRRNLPARRFAGRAKGSGSAQYPHAIEHGGSLWVIYSTNKEDIDIAEIPLAKIGAAKR
ncbi:MAG: exo-alpha-sialidase [Acidobacteria bacterium]|nr:exo-alpha-sialidase [Acidobacteriota bacterium]